MDESISSFVVNSFVIHRLRFCNFILSYDYHIFMITLRLNLYYHMIIIFLWWRSD